MRKYYYCEDINKARRIVSKQRIQILNVYFHTFCKIRDNENVEAIENAYDDFLNSCVTHRKPAHALTIESVQGIGLYGRDKYLCPIDR